MSKKIAVPVSRMHECSNCHGYGSGYVVHTSCSQRFLCEECFAEVENEYEKATQWIQVSREVVNKMSSSAGGYLLGRVEETEGQGKEYVVTECMETTEQEDTLVYYFNPKDFRQLRKKLHENSGLSVIGIYRHTESGTVEFCELDYKAAESMMIPEFFCLTGKSRTNQVLAMNQAKEILQVLSF